MFDDKKIKCAIPHVRCYNVEAANLRALKLLTLSKGFKGNKHFDCIGFKIANFRDFTDDAVYSKNVMKMCFKIYHTS